MSRQEEESRLVGFLNIEEAEFSGNFYRRYFVLDIANKKLAYYMDNPEVSVAHVKFCKYSEKRICRISAILLAQILFLF